MFETSNMDISAITSLIGEPEIDATILLLAVAFHTPLLMALSSRQRRSGHPVVRFLLWSVSAVYFPFMTFVLSYLTSYLPKAGTQASFVLVSVILIQFLRAKADMAAMAVAAVASPAAGDDDVNSLKIRPSTQSCINTFWVAGLVVYNIIILPGQGDDAKKNNKKLILLGRLVLLSPLWTLGACRTVLRFAAFQRATSSFALGRNVQLIDGYMLQLREGGCLLESEQQQVPGHQAVPRFIVTGERNQDVVESPLGYHVKRSSLQDERSRLVMLDRVWSDVGDAGNGDRDLLLTQDHKDLCLAFALFKCLRRRFAGYRLAAEAGSSWAFRFVCDGLLGPPDDHDRMFRVIATELSFASDFFHSPLPVASLGTTAAALHYLFSLIILPILLLLALNFLRVLVQLVRHHIYPLALLAFVLALVNAITEISEMVASVSSNWTKISIIGHLVRSRNQCARRFLACLLKCKAPKFWDDDIRQTQLVKQADIFGVQQQPWARRFGFGGRRQLSVSLSLECQNHHADPIKVPLEVKKAILESLSGSGGQLSDGTAAIRRHAFARGNDITWACRDGGGVVTTADAILVWHIATTLFDIRCSSSTSTSTCTSTPKDSDSTSPSMPSPVATTTTSSKVVACGLSRYCTYLVAEAPDLLPDRPTWITRRYEAVKKRIKEAAASKCSGDVPDLYQHLVDTFSGENSHSHEVLIKGVRLGKQLVEEAEKRQISQGGGGGGGREARAEAKDEVWELLSEFWSEMVLYLAPSDNVKVHIEALQRGGELTTLLWALLLHAGITSRPVEFNFTASVLLSTTEDPDAIVVDSC